MRKCDVSFSLRKVIVLSLLVQICCVSVCNAQKQKEVKAPKNIVITGTVVDANGVPVPNAVLFVDNVKTDVTTQLDGTYKIRVKSSAQELLALSLLAGADEEVIDGKTVIDFVLVGEDQKPSGAAEMDDQEEELVDVGYGVIKKDNMSQSVGSANVSGANTVAYQSIYDMIRGRVNGVQVSGKVIRVSGTSTLNASGDPLFVVDGVIVSSIDDIAPETVKSINVLKGPAATAYGTRGANGVILINRFK